MHCSDPKGAQSFNATMGIYLDIKDVEIPWNPGPFNLIGNTAKFFLRREFEDSICFAAHIGVWEWALRRIVPLTTRLLLSYKGSTSLHGIRTTRPSKRTLTDRG